MDLLTVPQAAERFNVTVRWIRRAVFERRLAYVKVGRLVRIESAELERYIEANRHPVA